MNTVEGEIGCRNVIPENLAGRVVNWIAGEALPGLQVLSWISIIPGN